MRTPSTLLCLTVALLSYAVDADAQVRRRRVVHRPLRAAVAPRLVVPAMRPVVAPPRRVLRAAVARTPVVPPSPVVTVLQRMETTLQYTRYSLDNRVDPLMGHYELDTPGLVTWVLRRATPAAHRAVFSQVRARSPNARDYHDIFANAPTETSHNDAWVRIPTVAALRPGDVIAWRRSTGPHAQGGNHVAFVVGAPVRTQVGGGGWLVRVTDSTAVPHDNDTRGPQSQHHSGLGTGTLLITADEHDNPTGYGWLGARTSVPTHALVSLGRPLR